jgi:hypothetical protein
MSKVLNEEINRIREVMGLSEKKPLVMEGGVVTDAVTGLLSKMYREGGQRIIDDAVEYASLGKTFTDANGNSYTIRNWTDLMDQATIEGKKISELIPGITDDIIIALGNSTLKKNLIDTTKGYIFNQNQIRSYLAWNDGKLTSEGAEAVRKNLLETFESADPRLQGILQDSNITKKLKGQMEPDYARKPLSEYQDAELTKRLPELKNKIIKTQDKLTQGESKELEVMVSKGILPQQEFNKLLDLKYPGINKMFLLVDEYNRVQKLGQIGQDITFEEWVISEYKSKLPNKVTEKGIRALRYFINPVRRLFGMTKEGSFSTALGKIIGVSSGAYILVNDGLEIIAGLVGMGGEKTGAANYIVNAKLRWKEYWEKDNPKVKIGDTTQSIYTGVDESNEKYKNNAPPITVMNPEKGVVKIESPNTISINGISNLFKNDENRFENFSIKFEEILFDFSKNTKGLKVNPTSLPWD